MAKGDYPGAEPWAIAAFAIDALIAAYNAFLTKPNTQTRKTLWLLVAAILFIAMLPILTDAFITTRQSKLLTIYRVRVTVVDAQNIPVPGATVRVTADNETKSAPDGSAELAIPKDSLPQNGQATIYADKDAAFLHGSKHVTLKDDPNPSITIPITPDATAEVKGSVQDESRHAISQARVSVPGGEAVNTDTDGNFHLPAHAARDQKVLIHAEKPGYSPTDQYHPAGDEPAVIVLTRDKHKL